MVTESARLLSDSFLQSNNLELLVQEIHGQNCDVLIYPGIGMETITLKLAALRLAPVQCTSWGHPVTSGMPTIDYYLSSELMEPVDGDRHYSEKLVRLPNLSVWYEPVEPIESDLPVPGIETDDVVYLCCQNLLKYLPQHDYVFPAIAAQVKKARFVFIASYVPELTEKFMQRISLAFQRQGLNVSDHVLMMPQLDEAAFSALNARADIFLDSMEWSGCNTVFESLPFNKPIVTLPGQFMRGRHGFAILKMMGVEETIASTPDEYVSIAVRLGQDRKWWEEISIRICKNKHKLYRDVGSVRSLEQFLVQVSGRSFNME
jgi:predicted O-linked N-acetylglucosamine transferase (SPINDLY family)